MGSIERNSKRSSLLKIRRLRTVLSALQYGVASIAMQSNEILIAVNAHENHVN